MTLCGPLDGGWARLWAAAANWLAGSASRLAGAAGSTSARLGAPVSALAVWWLDLVAARMVMHISPCASC